MSAVSRLSCTRVLFARACAPAKSTAARLTVSARTTGIASPAFLRCAVQRTAFAAVSKPKSSMHGFHCSAMAMDAEVNEPEPVSAVTEMPEPEPSKKVYVGNLSWQVTDVELRSAFEEFGVINECEVVMDNMGRSRGFGFVNMVEEAEAGKAVEGLNGTMLDGREMRVNFHVPRDPNAPRPEPRERRSNRFDNAGQRVYVGNLPWSFDDFDLQDTFEEFGTIVDARVITDRETGRSRGFGFVTMSSEEEVDRAIGELDGSVCEGRSIKVNKAER